MTADSKTPPELGYSEDHDWARIDGQFATFGVTWYAQDQLGEIVFFDAPNAGATVTRGTSYAELESVKAVSDVVAPLSGEVTEVNPSIVSDPATVNEDPYERGWLIKVRLTDPAEVAELLDAAAYRATIER